MPRAYEDWVAYGDKKMLKRGPTKEKNEEKGAYKGQNEGNRPSKFFAK